jgi:hypothetical protein
MTDLRVQADDLLDALNVAAVQQPLEVLSQLRWLELRVDNRLDLAVAHARLAGASWSQIGAELGMSKQSAAQRFRAASVE